MKASDLRIGNYLNGKQGHVIVTEIRTNNSVKILDNTSSFYVGICLQPIELTKEWLLNFGFEKKYDDLNWYIKGNYCFSFLKELDLIVFKIKFQTIGICTIKYVHEAQNIYFALTGEEL
jgi:hypothetical protein